MSGSDRHFQVEWTDRDAQVDYENDLRRLVSHRLVDKDTDLTAVGFLRAHKISPDAIRGRRDFDRAFYDEYRDYLMEVQGNRRAFGGMGRMTFAYPNEYAISQDLRSSAGRFDAQYHHPTATSKHPMTTAAVAKGHSETSSPKQYLDEAYRRITGDPIASEQSGATKKKLLSLQKWAADQTRKPELRAAVLTSGGKNRPAGGETSKGLNASDLDSVLHEGKEYPVVDFARGVSMRVRRRGSSEPYSDVSLCTVLSNPSDYEYEDSSQESIVRSLSNNMSQVYVLTENGPMNLSAYVASGCPVVHPVRTYGEGVPPELPRAPIVRSRQVSARKDSDEPTLIVEDRRRRPYRALSFVLGAFCELSVGDGFVKRVDPVRGRGYILSESQASSMPGLTTPEAYAIKCCVMKGSPGTCISCFEHRGSPECLGCCQCDLTSPYQRVKSRLGTVDKAKMRKLHSGVKVTLLDTETGATIQAPLDEYEILYPRTRYAMISAPIDEEKEAESDRPIRDFSPLRTEGFVDWVKQQYKTRTGDAPTMSSEEYGAGCKILLDVWTNQGFLPGHRFEGASKLTPERRIDRLSEKDQALLAKTLSFIARGLEGKLQGVVDDGTDFGDVLAQSAVPTAGKSKPAPSSMDGFHKELQRFDVDRRILPDAKHPPAKVTEEELERIMRDEEFLKRLEDRHPIPTSSFSFNADTGIHRRYTTDPVTGQTHRSYTMGLPRVATGTTHLGGVDVGGSRSFLATGSHEKGIVTPTHSQFVRWLLAEHPEVARSTSGRFLVLVPADDDFLTTQLAENWEHLVFPLGGNRRTSSTSGVVSDLRGFNTDLFSLDYLRPGDRSEVSRILANPENAETSSGARTRWIPLRSLRGLFE